MPSRRCCPAGRAARPRRWRPICYEMNICNRFTVKRQKLFYFKNRRGNLATGCWWLAQG